jgi:pSer/pThr/pTyr-binding forkhead associated (FHA) protein
VNFCPYCGARLNPARDSTVVLTQFEEPTVADDLTPDEIRAIEALPAGSALLIVARGPGQGARYLLKDDQVVAGRHPQNVVFLDDITVSRRHAVFARVDGHWTVSDKSSLNGTYVNRSLISAPVELRTGDEVQIGKYRLMFFAGPSGNR